MAIGLMRQWVRQRCITSRSIKPLRPAQAVRASDSDTSPNGTQKKAKIGWYLNDASSEIW